MIDGEPYYLGVFLVGAYQETLGDLHNLMGDTNVASVRVNEDGTFDFVREMSGDSIADVLSYVEYQPQQLLERFRSTAEQAVRAGRISVMERQAEVFFEALPVVTRSDLVRRRNVDEWDAGWVPSFSHGRGRLTLDVTGEFRAHRAHHVGEVTWAQYYPVGVAPDHRYYDYEAAKTTATGAVSARVAASSRVTLSAGLQLSRHTYEMSDDKLRQKGQAEQDLFFRKKDEELLKRLRQRVKLGDLTSALAEKLEIDDPELLKRITGFGVTLETGPAFLLAPLVEVAWAEEEATRHEDAVREARAEHGAGDTFERGVVAQVVRRPKLAHHEAVALDPDLAPQHAEVLQKGEVAFVEPGTDASLVQQCAQHLRGDGLVAAALV